jgi:hypothetical protein
MNDSKKIRGYQNVEQMKIVSYHITRFQRLTGVLMMNEPWLVNIHVSLQRQKPKQCS